MNNRSPYPAHRQSPARRPAATITGAALLAATVGLTLSLTPGAAWSVQCPAGDVVIASDDVNVCEPGMPPTDSLTIDAGVTIDAPNIPAGTALDGSSFNNTYAPVTNNGTMAGRVIFSSSLTADLLTLAGDFTNNGFMQVPNIIPSQGGGSVFTIINPDPTGAGLVNTGSGRIEILDGPGNIDIDVIHILALPQTGIPNPVAGFRLVNSGLIYQLEPNSNGGAIRVEAQSGASLTLDLFNNDGIISNAGTGPGIQVTGSGAVLNLDSEIRSGAINGSGGQPAIALSGGATLNARYAGSLATGADGGTDSHLNITGDTPSVSAFTRFLSATVHDDVRFDLGHDLEAETLTIGQGKAGVLAQSAGAITATTVNILANGRYLYAGGSLDSGGPTATALDNAGTLEIAPGVAANLPVIYRQQAGGRIRLNVDANKAISTLALNSADFTQSGVLEVSVDSNASLQVGNIFPGVILIPVRTGPIDGFVVNDDSASVDFTASLNSNGTAIDLTVVAQSQVNTPPQAGNVSLSGNAVVDGVLTLTYDYSDAEGDLEGASRFQWQRGGLDIAGATGRSYTLTADDAGQAISVTVTPEAATGASPGQAATSAVQTINQPPVASNPVISGSLYWGQTLSAGYTYSDVENDSEGASRIRWLRNGTPIYQLDVVSGIYSYVTGATYTTVTTDINQDISFEVTPVAATGSTTGATVTSPPVTILNVDNTPPVITLNGAASIDITTGDAYTDAGASAQDDIDGDISANIVVVNPVDTSTPGSYTITYNVSDAAGNAATEVTRTVTVSDPASGGGGNGGGGGNAGGGGGGGGGTGSGLLLLLAALLARRLSGCARGLTGRFLD